MMMVRKLAVLTLVSCLIRARCSIDSAVFRAGSLPVDTTGAPVHAHGGQITLFRDQYYWIGESEKLMTNGDWLSQGINLYSSPDLTTWKSHGMIFSNPQITDANRTFALRLERPKVLFNAAGQYWVMLFHLDDQPFSLTSVGLARSLGPDPTGPYSYVRGFKPDGYDTYDMGVYQEPDGRAYLIRSVENTYLGISQLRGDYLDTLGICNRLPRGEGPAIFRGVGDLPYVFASGLTGWSPNPPLLFQGNTSTELCGTPWAILPTPAQGLLANITFNSQSTAIVPLTLSNGAKLLMYMGDRWNFDGQGSVGRASYVWLPLVPRRDGKPGYMLKFMATWSPGDYAVDPTGGVGPLLPDIPATITSGRSVGQETSSRSRFFGGASPAGSSAPSPSPEGSPVRARQGFDLVGAIAGLFG